MCNRMHRTAWAVAWVVLVVLSAGCSTKDEPEPEAVAATTTTTAAAVTTSPTPPTALEGTWSAEFTRVDSVTEGTWTLQFKGQSALLTNPHSPDDPFELGGPVNVTATTLEIPRLGDCATGDYRFTIVADELTFRATNDSCEDRLAALTSHPWQRRA
jgi:hypothetical protein